MRKASYIPIHIYTIFQIAITVAIFIVTLTQAAPAFPVLIILLVPFRLLVMKRWWPREVLRFVDAWACREGTPEDDEDEQERKIKPHEGDVDARNGQDAWIVEMRCSLLESRLSMTGYLMRYGQREAMMLVTIGSNLMLIRRWTRRLEERAGNQRCIEIVVVCNVNDSYMGIKNLSLCALQQIHVNIPKP